MSTRLKSITGDIPKPLVRVKGKPIIERCLENLKRNGFEDIIVTVHYKHEMVEELLGNGRKYGLNISYAYENELLNTGGSLKNLESILNEDFFVCGGSFLLLNTDFQKAISQHKADKNYMTVILSKCADEDLLKFYGQAVVENGQIIRFQEKPPVAFSDLIHTTYQVISPAFFEYIDPNEKVAIPDVIPLLIRDNKSVGGYITEDQLINISSPELYFRSLNNPLL